MAAVCIVQTPIYEIFYHVDCKLTNIASDNGLSPDWRQAIIWTNAGILLIRTSGRNFNEIVIEIHIFSLKKSIWKCQRKKGVHFVSALMC